MRHLLLLAALAAACDETDKDGTLPDTGDAPATHEYTMARVPLPATCLKPVPRRFHMMSWFRANQPVIVEGFAVERGILMVGGIGLGGQYLDSAWLYDLTNARPSGCPWIRLRGDSVLPGAAGLAGGSLHFDFGSQSFVLVPGHKELTDGTIVSVEDIWTAPVNTLGPSLTFELADQGELLLPGVTVTTVEYSAADCNAVPDEDCWYYDETDDTCTFLESVPIDACTGAGTFSNSACPPSSGLALVAGCTNDPLCTRVGRGFTETWSGGVLESVAVDYGVLGLGQFAAAHDPVSGIITLFGGTVGCTGSSCSAWAALQGMDHRGGPQSLSLANPPVRIQLDPAAHIATSSTVDLGEWEIPPTGSLVWEGSSGVRFSAAAHPGRHWDYVGRSWETWQAGNPYSKTWLFGGTRWQDRGPQATRSVTLGELNTVYPEPDCWSDDYPISGSWVDNPTPSAWFTDQNGTNTVTEADAAVPPWATGTSIEQDTAGLFLAPRSLGALPDGLYQSTAVAVQDDAVLLVGGRHFDEPAGSATVWRVDLEGGSTAVVAGDSEVRYGAATVFDPIERRAFVFGGGTTSDVYEVFSPHDLVFPNETSTFDIDEVDLEIEFVPDPAAPSDVGKGTWVARMGFRFTHRCESEPRTPYGSVDTWEPDQCYADRVALHFGNPDVDGDGLMESKSDANVRLELVVSGARLPMGPRLLEQDGAAAVALGVDDRTDAEDYGKEGDANGAVDIHTWRLPRALVDGENATLFVTWDDPDLLDELVGGIPTFLRRNDEVRGAFDVHTTLAYGANQVFFDKGPGACGKRKAVVLRGLPMWMGSTPHAALDEDPLPLSSIHLVGPVGFTEVGIGPSETCLAENFEGFPVLSTGGACFELPDLLVRPSSQLRLDRGPTYADDVDLRLLVAEGLVAVPAPDHPDVAVYMQGFPCSTTSRC